MSRSVRQRFLNLLGGLVFGWIAGAGTASADLDIARSPLFVPGVVPTSACRNSMPGQIFSAASVTTNSARLDPETLIYHTGFRSDDWTGQLLAYDLAPDGTVGAIRWDAAGKLPSHRTRNILTRDGAVPGRGGGTEFLWADLGPTQRTALDRDPSGSVDHRGAERVAWLRGDASKERGNGGSFRNRRTSLGDIVHSDPRYVGAQDFGYQLLPIGTPGRTSYRAFFRSKLDSDGTARKPMLYVGANDGMLHGFDAETGVERFAYMPSTLLPELNRLAETDYAHRYFVDGPIDVGDAYIDPGGGSRWASVLVGTTGAGGRTVFALDVTDPHSVSGSDVLWEFTDPDLGIATSQPVVARMADGTWAAVFGNGYNSDSHRAVLFVVRLEDGVLLKKIDTGVGTAHSPNGLATPSLLASASRTIRAIFAGDLHGNLWAFDTSASSPSAWGSKYRAGPDPAPLFTARDANGNAQPITAPVEIGSHPEGGLMLYFGTGQYFEANDHIVGPNPGVQSVYGIRENGNGSAPVARADHRDVLLEQNILWEGTPGGSAFAVRVSSDTPVDWSRHAGWYMDLESPLDGAAGERVVSSPTLRAGRLLVATLVPSADPCAVGGSWIMELSATTGQRLPEAVLDISDDGNIDRGDLVSVSVGGNTVTVPVSGVRSREGFVQRPMPVTAGPDELRLAGASSGDVEVLRAKGRFNRGRVSWRQLQ